MCENVTVAILKYCADGSAYNETLFPASELYAVSLATGAQPTPLFYIMKCQELYGKSTAQSENPQPTDMAAFQDMYRSKLEFVSKKTTDLDGIGWRKNGLCYYVGVDPGKAVESVKELLLYLDNVLKWRFLHSDDIFQKIPVMPKLVLHVPEGQRQRESLKHKRLKFSRACFFFRVTLETSPEKVQVLKGYVVSSSFVA